MLDGAEPDLALAISMLRTVKANKEAHELWSKLTTTYYSVSGPSDLPLAVHRLRSSRPQFPLRSLYVGTYFCLAPPLLSALTATISLEAFWPVDTPARDVGSRLASVLKEVKSLRVVQLEGIPAKVGLEVLQSRTNWTEIALDSKVAAGVTAFAPLNHSDFSLRVVGLKSAEHLRPWLLNPHLTELALHLGSRDIVPGAFDGLQHCRNLSLLVLLFYHACFAVILTLVYLQ
jgi:hypothetical protein